MEIRTMQFEFCHGRRPRGDGYWAFRFGGWMVDGDGETKFFSGTYGNAKKEAVAYAKSKGFVQVEVLP